MQDQPSEEAEPTVGNNPAGGQRNKKQNAPSSSSRPLSPNAEHSGIHEQTTHPSLFDEPKLIVPTHLFGPDDVAISIKQPWATLIVVGIKTIEIRTWSTKRRGEVYIHVGAQPDKREHGWQFVTKDLLPMTKLKQGIIGKATVSECRNYPDQAAFDRDLDLHRNQSDWYQTPKMFGFVFDNPSIVEFIPLKGNLYFFNLQQAMA